MKKIILSTVGAIVLAAGGLQVATHPSEVDAATNKTVHTYTHQQAQVKNVKTLPEYATLAKKVNLTNKRVFVATDQANKRVIVVKAKNGRQVAKSIFIKKTNHLKVIDTKRGLVFNSTLSKSTKAPKQTNHKKTVNKTVKPSNTVKKYPEYKTLAKKVNLSHKKVKAVTNNANKRVLIVKTSSGKQVAKSIYVKRSKHLKVIDFHKGMVYNGFVK